MSDLTKGERREVQHHALEQKVQHKRTHREELEALKKENDLLRALLAKGEGDCVYCGLKKVDMLRCQSGFPGCGRMDDILADPRGDKA